VNGHEHENFVHEHGCEDPGQGPNRFWEISTAAHIDWPQQSRGPGARSPAWRRSRAGSPHNDYQGNRGARGEREDRNVIVKMNRPWPYAAP
jgi:hypothetical protein